MDSGIRFLGFMSGTCNLPLVIPWISSLNILCVPSENHRMCVNVEWVHSNFSAWYLIQMLMLLVLGKIPKLF